MRRMSAAQRRFRLSNLDRRCQVVSLSFFSRSRQRRHLLHREMCANVFSPSFFSPSAWSVPNFEFDKIFSFS